MSDCGGANFFRSYPPFPLPFIIRFALLGFFEEGPSHPPTGHGKGKGRERERGKILWEPSSSLHYGAQQRRKRSLSTPLTGLFPLLPFLYEARELHRPAEKAHQKSTALKAPSLHRWGLPFPFSLGRSWKGTEERENLERRGSWRESAQ